MRSVALNEWISAGVRLSAASAGALFCREERAVLVFIRPEEVHELLRRITLLGRLDEHIRVDLLDVLAERQFPARGRRREPEADDGRRRYSRGGEEFDDGAR